MKERQVNNWLTMEESCSVYCYCRLPDDGSEMIQRDEWNAWVTWEQNKLRSLNNGYDRAVIWSDMLYTQSNQYNRSYSV